MSDSTKDLVLFAEVGMPHIYGEEGSVNLEPTLQHGDHEILIACCGNCRFHSGPEVAGIVGVKKFQYDIWGDTVNTASRMESSGEVGHVNISEATFELVKENSAFSFTSRGKVEAKGKGEMEMYFVPQG